MLKFVVFILLSLARLNLPTGLLPSGVPIYTIYAFIFLLVCHILRLSLLDLITRIVIDEG